MKTTQDKENRTRIICPKCKGFLLEVTPYLSENQHLKILCRKCKSMVEIN